MSLTVKTNLSSLIVQSSLTQSTNGLNQAIERMTTGFKINGAKDNAAGYSINTSMTTKIGAYQVAEDNASMGLNLLMTASDSLSLINSHLSRIRDLAEQASNGTYGDDSLKAIQSEADARMSEINRIMSTTEYNGIKLFGESGSVSAGSTGAFIEEVTPLTEEEAIAQGYTIIKTADELQAMKDNLSGKYILMNDIDLSGYNWEAVGSDSDHFTGEFNGNGYVISNLTINNPTKNSQGLFGRVENGTLENIALENVDVTGNAFVGGLVGDIVGSITNSYSTGSVTGSSNNVGGLAGYIDGSITNSYSTGSVAGCAEVGGLAGYIDGSITNSYSTGSVTGEAHVGGLVGGIVGSITNSYSTGSATGDDYVGGFVGLIDGSITNSYSTGSVMGNAFGVGGFVGENRSGTFTNCYYDTQKSGQATGCGTGGSTDISGVTTSELNDLISAGTLPSFTSVGAKTAGIARVVPTTAKTSGIPDITLQVGIDSSESSKLTFNTGLGFALNIDLTSQAGARTTLEAIDNILSQVNSKQTELGSAQNRLESVLDSISVQYENLVSSRSTLRDADISEESSNYIKYQILQQASATLLATANQTPSIALQLL